MSQNAKMDGKGAESVKAKVQELFASLGSRFSVALDESVPAKILRLTEIYSEHPDFNIKDSEKSIMENLYIPSSEILSSQEQVGVGKKRKVREDGTEHVILSSGTSFPKSNVDVPINKLIQRLIDVLKKEVTDCVTLIGDLKVHIQLSIPKIEDGNNFGVQVQEDIVSELDRSESSCIQVIENLHKYYITRAKIVSKVLKYPGLMDYQQALIECDLKQYEVLKLSLLDLRNTLALLYSLVTKNIEKLRKPKESHHMRAMY